MLKPLILRFLKSGVRGGLWGGGVLGVASDSQLDAIAGGLAIVVSILWSLWEERSKSTPAVCPKPQLDQTLTVLAAAAFIAIGCGGCRSVTPEQAAYRSIGTIATSVDQGMKAFGEWVALGQAQQSDVDKARDLYGKYQAAMRIAKDAALTVKQNPQAGDWDLVLKATEASAADLLNFIAAITK